MSISPIRRGEGISMLSTAKAGHTDDLLREATSDNRLDALRDVALTLVKALYSLSSTEPLRDHSIKLKDEVQRFESNLIRTTLERTRGHQARAARLLGVKNTTLGTKIKRYRLSWSDRSPQTVGTFGDCEKLVALKMLQEAGNFGFEGVWTRKGGDESAEIVLSDPKGQARMTLSVDVKGGPRLQFLDETGKVIYSLPDASSMMKK